jgi:tetratricopeptide (TPR) repeat protein
MDTRTPQLLGRYELLQQIGEGGAGRVFLGRDAETKQHVAVKFLSPSLLHDEEQLARFRREAAILQSLSHGSILRLLDTGLEENFPFIVSEYVAGVSLRTRIADSFHWREVALIMYQIALALEHAHARGVIHRDLKPENVICAYSGGSVKVIDFGIARFIHDPKITQAPVGSFGYMAPEQRFPGMHLDARVDIYAWGTILDELLEKIADKAPVGLSQIVEHTRRPHRERRTISAGQIAFALRKLLLVESEASAQTSTLSTLLMDEPQPDPGEVQRLRAHVFDGKVAYARGTQPDLAEAEQHLRAALDLDPTDAEANAWLACTLHRQYYFGWDVDRSALDEALTRAHTAIERGKSLGAGYLALTEIFWDTGQHEEGLRVGRIAAEADPNGRDARHALATAYVYAGMAEKAIPIAEDLVAHNSADGDALYRLGEAYQLAGEIPASLDVFYRFIAAYPAIGVGYEEAAMSHLAAGAPDAARQLLERQEATAGTINFLFAGEVQTALGEEREAHHHWARGLGHYEQTLKSALRPRGMTWLAMLYARVGLTTDALHWIERAVTMDPANGYVLYRAAAAYGMLHMFHEASVLLGRAEDAGFVNWQLLRLEEAFYLRDLAGDPAYKLRRGSMEVRARALASMY